MKLFKTSSLVSVIKVSNCEASTAWYGRWLGEPDVIPMAGMAEWQIAEHAWLQLDALAGEVGKAAAVIGVEDVAACRQALIHAGIEAGEVVDWGFVLTCDFSDPDGNRISLMQLAG